MITDYIKPLQINILQWADSIAPDRKPKDAVVKLVSEASELLDAVLNGGDVEGELGDCLILLLDLAAMHKIDLVHAGWIKMDINRKRKWISDNGVIRRDNGYLRKAQADAGQAVPDLPCESGAKRSGT